MTPTTASGRELGMAKDMGALSGSHASTEPASRLRPSGFDPARMEARLRELLALEFDWNSYRAKPIDPACADRVRRFYPIMESLGLQPWITPNNNGGLIIERGGTDDYSVEFEPDGTTSVWFDGLSDADARAMVGLFAQLRALDALATGTRSAETRSKAPSEGCQSGPSEETGNAPKVSQ